MRDGWWYVSNPVFTLAVKLKNGRLVEGPPMAWSLRGKRRHYDRVVFLGE